MMRSRRGGASGVARTGVALLTAIGIAVGLPGHVGGGALADAPEPPPLAEAVATGRAAVVTLKIPGTARPQAQPVTDDWADLDELFEEPDGEGDAGDFTVGSAVIIEASGIAVTTARLARRADALEAAVSDGRRLPATIIGVDDRTDVAVLSVCCDTRPLPAIRLGNSDRVRAGDWVVAIGAPFGLDASATASIVAAVAMAEADGVGGLIQSGGSVTAGYAGGPLVDTRGAMIGLVVGNGAGAGLALPSNTVRKIVSALLEHGRVRRGWLGATGQPLDPGLARAFGARDSGGVVVVDVLRDSPAARAGLVPGDIIRELDGRRLDSPTRMAAAIASFAPGRVVTLNVWRRGRDVVLAVPLGEEPDREAVGSIRWRAKARLGIEVGAITSDMGVVVSAVDYQGPAARAGIRRGDVIRELNGRATRSMADFEGALAAMSEDRRVVILLQRGPSSSYITYTP